MRNQYDSYVTKELEVNLKDLELDINIPPRNKQRNFKIDLSTPKDSKNGYSEDSDPGEEMFFENPPGDLRDGFRNYGGNPNVIRKH